jgi:dihydroorotase
METQTIDEGNDAHFTIFSTSEKTKFNLSDWRSLSRNNPLIGTELSGKVYEL